MNFLSTDIVTPLKKRRLMRESIESLSSPHSPSLENGMDDTDATTSSLTNDTHIDQKMDTMDQHLLCATNEDSMPLSPKVEEDSTCKGPEFEEAEDSQVKDVSSACVHFESNGGKYSKKKYFYDRNHFIFSKK